MNLRHFTIIAFLLLASSISTAQESNISQIIAEQAEQIEEKVIAWRHDFHEHPELSNREFRTAKIVADHLKSLGIEVQTGVAVTGVVGILKGGKPGPVIALRADMDALPVKENNDLPFASKVITTYKDKETYVMHACGHDSHMAILMGTAEVLAGLKDQIPGTVKFIFQPAEEGAPMGEEGGAELMVKEGVLKNPDVDVIFGLHIDAQMENNQIAYRPGGFMAGIGDFKITVKGKPSHGSKPWHSVDPILTASQIVVSLQQIVSRNVNLRNNPAVVTVGSFHGGNRSNIIPPEVEIIGDVRAFSESDEELIYGRIREIATNTAEAFGATAEVELPYKTKYPVTFNHVALTQTMLPTLQKSAGKENVFLIPANTGAEDFSFFAKEVPGLFFRLGGMPSGIDPKDAAPHHTPEFMLEDSSFKLGVITFCNLVFDYGNLDKKIEM